MPIIPNPREPTFTAITVFLPAHAVMLYPRSSEEEQRRLWYAAAMAREYAICRRLGVAEANLSYFHAWIPDLWAMKQAPSRVYQDGLARMNHGLWSGAILLQMLSLARYHPRHCKLERLNALMSEYSGRSGKRISESSLEKLWPKFKSVSHLWASYVRKKPKDVPTWIEFLNLAEDLRQAGEERRLLDPAETWRPDGAHPFHPSEFDPEPLKPDELAFLDEQFPE